MHISYYTVDQLSVSSFAHDTFNTLPRGVNELFSFFFFVNVVLRYKMQSSLKSEGHHGRLSLVPVKALLAC